MSMSFELPQSALDQLKGFIMLCRTKPEILHKEELSFFREYLASLGARLPPVPEAAPKEAKPEAKPGAGPPEPASPEEVPKSSQQFWVKLKCSSVVGSYRYKTTLVRGTTRI